MNEEAVKAAIDAIQPILRKLVESAVRAYVAALPVHEQAAMTEVISCGPYRLEIQERRAWKNGEIVKLSRIQFNLLAFMIHNKNRLVTKRELLLAVWGPGYVDQVQNLTVQVSNMRDKLSDKNWVQTVNGEGYRMLDVVEDE